MNPAHSFGLVIEFNHVDHIFKEKPNVSIHSRRAHPYLLTEIGHVKDFQSLILRDCSQQLAICRQADTNNGSQMRAIMLDKLYTACSLFPKLEMAIHRCCDNEIVAIEICRQLDELCCWVLNGCYVLWWNGNVVECISMHITSFIHIGVGQVWQEQLFMCENWRQHVKWGSHCRYKKGSVPRFFLGGASLGGGGIMGPMSSNKGGRVDWYRQRDHCVHYPRTIVLLFYNWFFSFEWSFVAWISVVCHCDKLRV